jgi:ABC-type lipoprotein release transport system permease subunit
VLAAVVALLGSAALVAAFVPARRALAVDPARVLRSE